MYKLLDDVPDGIYTVTYLGDNENLYRAEKIDGVWFMSDGTGWKELIEYPETITSVRPSNKTKIKKDHVYKNTYPLTDFFPKED